jgi:two-component system nitrogen regulation response regulator NtrX
MIRIDDREPRLVGTSVRARAIHHEIDAAARSDAKVLITGETGVGKDVVARLIHQASARSAAPLATLNCAGVPDSLMESELFGHVRGSFTGAYRDKPGKIEIADEGTIFLDEIGEMTLRMQGLLLRFLETGEIQKVGADRTGNRVDVRTVAATNRNLREMIAQGLFREDLFYRLNVIHLIVPALRERKEDIRALVEHFLGRMARPGMHTPKQIAPEAMTMLLDYHWPGNVRELQNVIERMIVRARTEVIGVNDVPHEVRSNQRPGAPQRERRRTIADELYERITNEQQSFWTTVYPLFMQREITRSAVRDVVRRGLQDARGNYKIVARKFNLESDEYKKFLNFLRKHHCQPSFKEFR